jgi:hypothetical protein
MTFIEVQVNEDQAALEKLVREAYLAGGNREELPGLRFGRVMVWKGRFFQQLEVSLIFEDKIFSLCNLPGGRARVQVGSIRRDVFTTPPEAEGEPAARIKEGGRCGPEYLSKPFYGSDYDRDA